MQYERRRVPAGTDAPALYPRDPRWQNGVPFLGIAPLNRSSGATGQCRPPSPRPPGVAAGGEGVVVTSIIHSPRRKAAYPFALVFALAAILPAGVASAEGGKHALLVGCTAYPELAERFQLAGPANDVELFRSVLEETFAFDGEHIRVLSENEAEKPTRENIARGFQVLAETAGKGDQVVILLAGHGSQQPADADADADDPEPDGYDELFLPRDVEGWDGQIGALPNAIVDDEIRDWLAAIRATGAKVWFLADSCHSGTLVRGDTEERSRRILPEDLGIPAPAPADGEQSRGGGAGDGGAKIFDNLAQDDGLVAMYAARADQETPEFVQLEAENKVYGLFSYTVAGILERSQSTMSYRELIERVSQRYRADGRYGPSPVLEGGAADREVLGLAEWPQRPSIGLTVDGATVTVDWGRVHGVRPGSILSVFPAAGEMDADQSLGYLQVQSTTALSSVVEPVEWEGRKAPASRKLETGCRCRLEYVDYGSTQMMVALQTAGPPTKDPSARAAETHAEGEAPGWLEEAYARAVKVQSSAGTLFARTADPALADWFVRADGVRVVLVPRDGWFGTGAGAEEAPRAFYLPNTQDPALLGQELHRALNQIYRAHQLMGFANDDSQAAMRGSAPLFMELRVMGDDGTYHSPAGEFVGRQFREGDQVALYWRNDSRRDVDVTVLFVDAELGISPFFPYGENNRFAMTQEFLLPIDITGEPVGPEQLVVIALSVDNPLTPPQDLSYMAQPGLSSTRGSRGDASPLERWLSSAMDGSALTRGLARPQVEGYDVQVIDWVTVR